MLLLGCGHEDGSGATLTLSCNHLASAIVSVCPGSIARMKRCLGHVGRLGNLAVLRQGSSPPGGRPGRRAIHHTRRAWHGTKPGEGKEGGWLGERVVPMLC